MAAAKKAAKKAAPGKPKPAAKKAAAPPASAKKPAPKRDPSKGPVVKTRVVVPMDVYDAQKEAVKAPFREHEMKWNFLGEGRGLYKRLDNGVHCFVQFKDDGVHYSVWGDDAKRRDAILAAWRKILGEAGWTKATASGEAAVQAEAAQVESEALKLWRMQEPQPRAGEPEFFLKKRRDEWLAKRPTG